MAKKDNNKKLLPTMRKSVSDSLKKMQDLLDNIYQDTYSSPVMNTKDLDDITDTMSKSIDDIISKSYGDNTMSGMSKMMSRFDSSSDINTTLRETLDNLDNGSTATNILDIYNQNLWIKDFDNEVDTVLKYMPRLKEALDCLKDCVLSADHFSKEYITFKTYTSDDILETFSRRSEDMKNKYALSEFYENVYDDASKYGEAFVYIVPYNREIAKLLNNKNSRSIGANKRLQESTILFESGVISEEIDNAIKTICESTQIERSDMKINVTFDTSGYIHSLFESTTALTDIMSNSISRSFTEQYSEIIQESKSSTKLDNKLIPDEFDIPEDVTDPYNSSAEGLINRKDQIKPLDLKVPGCILKKLDRAKLLILKIDHIIFGYLYVETIRKDGYVNNFNDFHNSMTSSGINNISAYSQNRKYQDLENRNSMDVLLSYISGSISQMIDAKFVNANQDLAKEIYMTLKHNEMFNDPEMIAKTDIRVTFIPPDDIEHVYFKKDEITGRGISDLNLSLFPAKLYISLYINDTINNLTRGQDRRVYYVKQNVETNISATLLNVLNQIKKGNFGIRQMENLGSILNILGRFNDYVIPVNNSNDPPINFEIMPGMKSELDTELMDRLEKMAINPTDVPLELIESRQSLDFAIQATMVNTKLMRKTYNRQRTIQAMFSRISTKIYNYEYGENINIEVQLPAPAFLNVSNSSNLFSTVDQFVANIMDIMLYDETDDVKAEFRKLATGYFINSQIDIPMLETLKKRAKLAASTNKSNQEEQQ